jgi:hypothetical protein
MSGRARNRIGRGGAPVLARWRRGLLCGAVGAGLLVPAGLSMVAAGSPSS